MIYQKYKLSATRSQEKSQIIIGTHLDEWKNFFQCSDWACPSWMTDKNTLTVSYIPSLFKKILRQGQTWWSTPLIPVFDWLKQEDHHKLKALTGFGCVTQVSFKFGILLTQPSPSLVAGNMDTYHHASLEWTRF